MLFRSAQSLIQQRGDPENHQDAVEGEARIRGGGTHLEPKRNAQPMRGGQRRAAARGGRRERIAEAPFGSEEGNGGREGMEGSGGEGKNKWWMVPRRVQGHATSRAR